MSSPALMLSQPGTDSGFAKGAGGVSVSSPALKAFPTQEWIQALLRELEELLSHLLHPAQEWRRLLGGMLSLTEIFARLLAS